MVVGIAVGLVAGYVGGAVDTLLMRIADVQLTFPAILIALLVDGVIGAALPQDLHDRPADLRDHLRHRHRLWPQFARTVRGSTLVEPTRNM